MEILNDRYFLCDSQLWTTGEGTYVWQTNHKFPQILVLIRFVVFQIQPAEKQTNKPTSEKHKCVRFYSDYLCTAVITEQRACQWYQWCGMARGLDASAHSATITSQICDHSWKQGVDEPRVATAGYLLPIEGHNLYKFVMDRYKNNSTPWLVIKILRDPDSMDIK